MFFRLAGVSFAATVTSSLAMAGSGDMALTSVQAGPRVAMAGTSVMYVSTPIMFFRLAKVSFTTNGVAGDVLMPGFGTMSVAVSTQSYFRLAGGGVFAPQVALTWDGTQWLTESLSSSVTMDGTSGFALTATQTGSGVAMAGAGTLRVFGVITFSSQILFAGVGTMSATYLAPVMTGLVSMDGISGLSLVAITPSTVLTFIPPFVQQRARIKGSLFYSFKQSMTVWHDASGWHALSSPDNETLLLADRIFTTPTVVDLATANALSVAGIGTIDTS